MALSNRYGNSRLLARVRPATVFAVIIITALIAFEMFNFSTTEYALHDLLGGLKFMGLGWATILSIAFCGIDFAGIARLFTPERGADEPKEVWYLLGAWLMAATMNAILTWWGVSMAVASHQAQSISIMDSNTLTKVVPVFVALMVWVIRILVIGTISVAGERFFWGNGRVANNVARNSGFTANNPMPRTNPLNASGHGTAARPAPRSMVPTAETSSRPEPSYQSLTMSARPTVRSGSTNPDRSGRGL